VTLAVAGGGVVLAEQVPIVLAELEDVQQVQVRVVGALAVPPILFAFAAAKNGLHDCGHTYKNEFFS
jgi:hypothetical protein